MMMYGTKIQNSSVASEVCTQLVIKLFLKENDATAVTVAALFILRSMTLYVSKFSGA